MTTATKTPTRRKPKPKRPPIPAKWLALFKLIPGYDPIKTAAPGDWFDAVKAENAVDFFHECLTHVKGAKAGEPLILEPWQQAKIGCLFGWMNAEGLRRYREAFFYVARKNGKTTETAGIVLLLLFCDGEPGADIYSAAAEKDQAAIIYDLAKAMVQAEPVLLNEAKIYSSFRSIEFPAMHGMYRPISADAHTKHGYNAHGVVIDELHAQKNRKLVDVLVTSTGSRDQPLIVHLTTADVEGESICNEKYDYACNVRDGIFSDPSFLPVIFEATADDDWNDVKTWRKANPNLGVSVHLSYLEREYRKAKQSPAYESTFKRLHLNMITSSISGYISLDVWDKCKHPLADPSTLTGRRCFAGLDLSSRIDLTAFVLVFPPIDADPFWRIVPRNFIPRGTAAERELADRVPYSVWEREGWLTMTPGNRVQYSAIQEQILEDGARFDIVDIAGDPWNLEGLAQNVMAEGSPEMIEFRQGFRSMSTPTKELEKLAIDGKIAHDGNPCLRWQVGNVRIDQDAAENWKPIKEKNSTKRIDAVVATIMAIGRAMVDDQDSGTSVYATADRPDGLIVI